MWRAGLKLGLGGAAVASSDDVPMALKAGFPLLPLRLLRDSFTAASIAFGFLRFSLRLHPSSHLISPYLFSLIPLHYFALPAWAWKKTATSGAESGINGGIYINPGQHLGQLLFAEFNPVPLTSASLAQVHAARIHDGHKVAIKGYAHRQEKATAHTSGSRPLQGT
ncbi:ABC1 protein [Carex littledalei]|uniref:ABC1 protein n=1 Tax=Carex littledalei TaxID=544730 RepID=A0A833R334_9POAL|nr:ABC1 protein [Carex littledalei]